MQLPDRSMSDASFLAVSLAAFSAINVAKDGVEEWLKSSEDVRHTISNVQAAATSSGSYITLYRHPLNVCNDRFSSSEDEIKSRRLMRRAWSESACDKAQTQLADNLWADSGLGPEDAQGTCGGDHAPVGRCKRCLDAWKGYYIVKNETKCASGQAKTKVLQPDSSLLADCAEACRKEATVGGLQCEYFVFGADTCTMVFVDLPARPAHADIVDAMTYPGFDRCQSAGFSSGDNKCLSLSEGETSLTTDFTCCAKSGMASCKTGYFQCPGVPGCAQEKNGMVTTCCIQNSTNTTLNTCPTQPAAPANWKYQFQTTVPELCTDEVVKYNLYRQVGVESAPSGGEGMGGSKTHWCWDVCKDKENWLKPCSATCQNIFKAVFTECSGCKGGQDFCVDSDSNSDDDKKAFEWANKLPMAPQACVSEPSKSECTEYVVSTVEGGASVPGLGIYQKTMTDAAMMEQMTAWAPPNCKPPFYDWWEKDTYLCNQCFSVATEASSGFSIWGGTSGFCDYAAECQCPDDDSCDTAQVIACQAARTPCQCDCRDMLSRAAQTCGAMMDSPNGNGTISVNPPVCDVALTNACSIRECKNTDGSVAKWADKESGAQPSVWGGGGDNSCQTDVRVHVCAFSLSRTHAFVRSLSLASSHILLLMCVLSLPRFVFVLCLSLVHFDSCSPPCSFCIAAPSFALALLLIFARAISLLRSRAISLAPSLAFSVSLSLSTHYVIHAQNTATHCNTLQHTATHCNTLQHTATYYVIYEQHASTHSHTYALSLSHPHSMHKHICTSIHFKTHTLSHTHKHDTNITHSKITLTNITLTNITLMMVLLVQIKSCLLHEHIKLLGTCCHTRLCTHTFTTPLSVYRFSISIFLSHSHSLSLFLSRTHPHTNTKCLTRLCTHAYK